MAEHNELGKKGEEEALNFLRSKGYEILGKNWRWRDAEVDIIAKGNGFVSFVEVKTRRGNYFGEPEAFVTRKKQKSYIAAANAYVTENGLNEEVRFDIIGITVSSTGFKINHIESAFSSIQ